MEIKKRKFGRFMSSSGLTRGSALDKADSPFGGNDRGQNGFTLLEVLVSVGIISIITLVVAQSFFTTTRSNTKSDILKEVKQNGDEAMGIMSDMIRSSEQINSVCDPNATGSASIDVKNPNGQVTTFGCSLDSSGVTRIASTSSVIANGAFNGQTSTEYLTGTGVTLGGTDCNDINMSLRFTCTPLPNGGSNVIIAFFLSQPGTPVNLFQKAQNYFYTTVETRNK